MVALEMAHDRESVELRHVQVEQNQIRAHAIDHGQGVATGFRFAHDRHVVASAQQRGQERPRRPFVIRDDDAHQRP